MPTAWPTLSARFGAAKDNAMADGPDHFTLTRSTAYLLYRAQQVAAERFAKRGKERQLSLRQFMVLSAIAERPGSSQNDLVRSASVDRSTLADMLKRLESVGLVIKGASERDARANALELTAAGRKLLAEADEDARKADQAILDALPKSKRKSFQDMLQRLAKALDEAAEKAEREERKRRKRDLKRTRDEEKKLEKAK
jgi:MarR family transcriptional regulator, temperature-dependent positive regulator of motility